VVEPTPPRPLHRQFFAMLVIVVATGQALGLALKMPALIGANDISRWCTVWSLLERGTYVIDDCPWQKQTMDKVQRPDPSGAVDDDGEPVLHFYSSKPPFLPTLIAGALYPFRAATGVPLDKVVLQERSPRDDQREEIPKPAEWPVAVFYFDPVIVLLNVAPLAVYLLLFARLLDRYARNDWAWMATLVAAAWGSQLFAFGETLNNHSVAAFSAFFALYAFLNIWDGTSRTGLDFAAAGFFAAFCACNELPAALFGVILFGTLVARFPRQTLLYFVPAAALPIAGFLASQYMALGTFVPAYAEFGGPSYNFAGSYWNTPLEADAIDDPRPVYLLHMLIGHHGVLSLTPIFAFSFASIALHLAGRMRRLRALAAMTAVLTVALLAFYTWKTTNYGGSTQGLRWLFWLHPFWLILLPPALEPGQDHRGFRALGLAAIGVSAFTVGYALRMPWSHPWMLDLMEHLNWMTLKR